MTSSNGGTAGQAHFTRKPSNTTVFCSVAFSSRAHLPSLMSAATPVSWWTASWKPDSPVSTTAGRVLDSDWRRRSRQVRELTVGIGEVHYDDKTGDLQFVAFAASMPSTNRKSS